MPVSSVFHDYLYGPWEDVRGYLIDELEQLHGYVQNLSNNADTLNTANVSDRVLTLNIDGGGSPLTSGMEHDVIVPYKGTITSITLLADVAGSVVVDVWRSTFQTYPPTSTYSIVGSNKLSLASAAAVRIAPTLGWKPDLLANDTLRFHIDSASTITRLSITLVIATT